MTFPIDEARAIAQSRLFAEDKLRDPDELIGEARMARLLVLACEEIETLQTTVVRLTGQAYIPVDWECRHGVRIDKHCEECTSKSERR